MAQEQPDRILPFAVTRRGLLTGGGVVAVGTGAALVGAAALGDSSGPGDLSAETVYNVRTFGATGDASTDDTAGIQRAISAAAGHGGIVFFPPGTYVTGRLTMHS